MLKTLDPLLSPDLLHILAAMGHGDELAIVDANFPAAALARRLVRLDGIEAPRALAAVLSLLPLDDFVDAPLAVMRDPDAKEDPPVLAAFRQAARAAEGRDVAFEALDRFAFYDRTRSAFAVLATGEQRLYGCILAKKGVIRPRS
ncbi:MAG: ribose ABC transporter [Acetobacteraceae bacterium]|nr:ribose ABC transporter [Acetobacteraceae bacterium]